MNNKSMGEYFEKAPGVSRSAAILLYDGVTLQDWVGPYHALNPLSGKDLTITFVAKTPGTIKDDRGRASFIATNHFNELPHPDILIVPGGNQTGPLGDRETLDWVRTAHETSEYTVAVCSGSIILAATGALEGKRATTLFLAKEVLANFGATYVAEHYVEDGKILSAAGTSGGIEAGLRLVEKLAGQRFAEAIQLATEYSPQPLYGTGDATKASAELQDYVMELFQADMQSIRSK